MNLSQRQIYILAGAVVLLLVLGITIALNFRSSSSSQPVTLAFWGTEDISAFDSVFQAYHAIRPNVQINYKKIAASDYDAALVDALAAGTGPDVLMVGNRDLPKAMNKLTPALQTQLPVSTFENDFPTVAETDFVSNGSIYALPLYVDSLAMFYNKDLFDNAAITSPPATWDDLLKIISPLKKIDQSGNITQAAIALGGSTASIANAPDLLSLLMLQNGTMMATADRTEATFAQGDNQKNPGLAALNFYLQFANAGTPYYTWNDGAQNALDSFAAGKDAMMLNYASAISALRTKSPFLKFGIAPVPQPSGASIDINYPSYQGLAVSKQSKAAGWAWDFIIFATTNADASRGYLTATGHPPALRSLINTSLSDTTLGVFAKSALTARSWYEINPPVVEEILNHAIVNVLTGKTNSGTALRDAQDEVSQLMRGSAQ